MNWKALEKSPRKLRIGLMLDAGSGQKVEKEVREVVVKAAKAFESAGAVITEIDGILTPEMLEGLDNFWRARTWDELSKLSQAERGKTLPYILNWAEAGAKLSGVDVVRGFNQTMAIRAAAAKLFCEVDYVISPVSPVVNFPAEFAAPLNDPAKPFEHICFTVPWNMSENPALSINGGYDKKGFPIGVQIIGRRFDDIGVLGMMLGMPAITMTLPSLKPGARMVALWISSAPSGTRAILSRASLRSCSLQRSLNRATTSG